MYTWTPKVCKIMAFMAIIRGLGLLFYILLGFRYVIEGLTELQRKDVGANFKYRIHDWEDANPGPLLVSQGLKPVFCTAT